MVKIESQNENPEFLNEYLKYTNYISGYSDTTIKELCYDIRTFLRYLYVTNNNTKDLTIEKFKNISIKEFTIDELKAITPYIITDYIMFLRNFLGNEVKARNRKLSSLKNFFKYLDHINHISNDPAKNISAGKIGKRNPKYLNLNESKKLLAAAIKSKDRNNLRNYTIICILLNCCLRVNEIVNINISDIDFEEKTLKVLGKGNKERIVYIDEAVEEAIKEYLKIRPNLPESNAFSDALFLSERRQRIAKRTVQHISKLCLSRTLDEGQTGYHTHTLRHTGATLLYNENDINIFIIEKILGHSNLSSTQIYTHVSDKKLKEIVDKFSISSLIENKEVLSNE